MAKQNGEPSARAQLATKERELAAAEASLKAAEAALDVEAAVQARTRVDVLRGFVATLRAQVTAEARANVITTGTRLRAERSAQYAEACKELAPATQRAREAIASAGPAVDAAFTVYARAVIARHEVELLCAALPDLPPVELPPVPRPPDLVEAVVALERAAIPRPARLTIPRTASDTPEQVRRATQRALHRYVERHGQSLDEELRTVLDALAPAPEETPDEKAKRAKREREAAEFENAVAGEAVRVQRRSGPLGAL